MPGKLLIVTDHFPPSAASGSFRMLGFARHLPKFGWQPIVVAPPMLPWEPVDGDLPSQIPADTPVYHVPYPQGRGSKLLRRVARRELWLPKAAVACGQAIRRHRPDALLTSSPPTGINLLGLFLKCRHQIPWVADFRDPWVTDGRPETGWRAGRYWAAGAERAVMTNADVIVANAPRAAAALRAAYPRSQHKITAIPNGFDPETFGLQTFPKPLRETLRIVHTGELWGSRDPRPFLDALRDLERGPRRGPKPFHVCFLGRADRKCIDLAAEVRQRGLDPTVEVGEQVPYKQAIQSLLDSDILLLLDNPGRLIGVPAKLYEYIGTGRPILALAEPNGDVAWVLRQSRAVHRIAAPTDPELIQNALRDLATELVEGQFEPPDREKRARFSRERLAGHLAEKLDSCVIRNEPAAAGSGAVVAAAPAAPRGEPRPGAAR